MFVCGYYVNNRQFVKVLLYVYDIINPMKSFFKKIYVFIQSLPDRFYPFASEIEGKMIRGRKSYAKAVANAFELYGSNWMGYRLAIYRGFFHVIGSVIFMVLATLIARDLFGSETALYVLLGAAVCALIFQEFYYHPKHFLQPRKKSVVDTLSWIIPMLVYVSVFN